MAHTHTHTGKLLILVVIATSLFSVTKPSLIFISLVQFIFISIQLFKRPQKWVVKILSLVFVAIISMYTLVNIGNQDAGWGHADPTGRTTQEIAYAYLTSDFNPNADELKNYFGVNGAPMCAISAQLPTENNLGGPMEHAAALHSMCNGFSDWIKTSFYPRYFIYSITHLHSVFELTSHQIRDAFIFPNFSELSEFLPSFQSKLIDFVTISAFIYLFFLFIINFRNLNERNIFILLIFLTMASFSSILFSLLIQPTHAGDISRQNYVSSLLLRLLIVFMALFINSNIANKGESNHKFH
jgi:hypothetical protein